MLGLGEDHRGIAAAEIREEGGMKTLKPVLWIAVFLLGTLSLPAQTQGKEFPKLSGPYLGQKPPGMTPEIFAPGIVSSNGILKHSPLAVSPDGGEVFWSIANPLTIYTMRLENGRWTIPELAPFAKGIECSSPVFSPDHSRLFFTSQIVKDGVFWIWLWAVEKEKAGWSKPKQVDAAFNNGQIGYQVSVAGNGTIYFDAEREGNRGDNDIYSARLINGKYAQPVNIGAAVNSEWKDSGVYVAADESYLLFRRVKRNGQNRVADFFASFRKKDGTWTAAVNIGDRLGVDGTAFWIGGTEDGKYIFFVKKAPEHFADIYWVSAKIIEELRPKELKY
jgi:hypothetical protein